MNSANRYTPYSKKQIRRQNSDPSVTDPVHVYCRLRPLKSDADQTPYIKLISPDTLVITTPLELKGPRKETHYKFKHIFTEHSSQREVFSHVAYPLLQDLLSGRNGLLFTYGVTGSGKTYTLTGEQNDPGVMPRSIDTLFNSIGEHQTPKFVIKSDKMNGFEVQSEEDALQDRMQHVRSTVKAARNQRKGNGEKISYDNDGTRVTINESNLYAVFVSYKEIYNNSVFDLLDESTGKTLQNKILREDTQKNMYVNGVVEIEVKSAEEAFEVFNAGQNRKRMAATLLNAGSSRSHSIFNIRVAQIEQVATNCNGQPMIPDGNLIKVGQLSLVDLAGSERTSRTQNTGARLKEASSINNSLMSLRTCLEILRENQMTKGNRLIPYRDSRLTYLFKNYFEGEGCVKMIVCINPSIDDFEENMQVLKFAEMTQDVKIARAEPKYTPLKKTISKTATPARPKTVTSTTPFILLPEVPIVKFDCEHPELFGEAIKKVMNVLKSRQVKSKSFDRELDEKQGQFRKRLVEINQENVLTKTELRSLKAVMHKEKQKAYNLNMKLQEKENEIAIFRAQREEDQNTIRSLHYVISEKDLRINHNILEREKTKQKIALVNEQRSHELDAKLRRQREHLGAELRAKETKLRKVKEIIESEVVPLEVTSVPRDQEYVSQVTQTPRSECNGTVVTTGTVHQSRRCATVSTPRPRRSRSVGEVWLEHNSVKPCPLGTVMQPKMNKRKSVTKLDKASDVTNPKQSKYCLLAQEALPDGELETKLYKADIVPTCGGGAQVIFNDVERLRQESPTRSDS